MPPPLDRRRALQLGALGAASVVVGGVGLARTGPPRAVNSVSPSPEGSTAARIREPVTLSSEAGRLSVSLSVAERETEIAGVRGRVLTYNGGVPGPTLRVRPGDDLAVRLSNGLDVPTNLHTHGLHASPRGHGDNALLSLGPGQTIDYRYALPSDHPTGVFWYHPHRHGLVAEQIFGGLYGAIVVTDDDVPVARERVLVVSDISLNADGTVRRVSTPQRAMGREGDLLLVNGMVRPVITARPGERERWRVINACTARYLRLALPGQSLRLLGMDGGHEPSPRAVEDLLLAPGNRADLLVTMRNGTSALRTLGYDRGMSMADGMMGARRAASGAGTLAMLAVAGTAVADLDPVPERAPDRDLRGRLVRVRRDIAFTMGMGAGMTMRFGFDGRAFDVTRDDQRVHAGAVEEWRLWNRTGMDHPFHLHVWPMQVIEQGGSDVTTPTWRDVVNVPAGERVRVLLDFSRYTGRTVYHCHILDHEDAGMMGIVKVL